MLSRAEPVPARRPAKIALAVVGVAAYLILVYLAQTLGPNQSEFPIWATELWNYAFAAVAMLLTYVVTSRVKRPLPQLPTGAHALGRLVMVLLLTGVLIVLFYLAVITRWPPFFAVVIFDYKAAAGLGLPPDVTNAFANVVPGGLVLTLILVYVSLRYVRRFGAVGFHLKPLDWLLGLGLIALAMLVHVMEGPILGISPTLSAIVPVTLWGVPLFFLQLLVNGLQEETLFRGYVLPQLQALLRQPVAAMLVMIVLFDLAHLPLLLLYYHLPAWPTTVQALFPVQPTGLVFGYAYWRSRSVVPGFLLHTYTSLWAFPYL